MIHVRQGSRQAMRLINLLALECAGTDGNKFIKIGAKKTFAPNVLYFFLHTFQSYFCFKKRKLEKTNFGDTFFFVVGGHRLQVPETQNENFVKRKISEYCSCISFKTFRIF